MNKIVLLYWVLLVMPVAQAETYSAAEAAFEKQFPNSWPPGTVSLPLAAAEQGVVQNLVAALSEVLERDGIKHSTTKDLITITPLDQGGELNRAAFELAQLGIILAYDPIFFAQKPFSVGTFQENGKRLLLSHLALADPKMRADVLSHERVHVATYQDRLARKASVFYCRFTGADFTPDALSCDEMNAYYHDLTRLEAAGRIDAWLKKVPQAKDHVAQIPKLIKGLDLHTQVNRKGLIMISGKVDQTPYQIEFEDFSLFVPGNVQNQLARISQEAERVLAYLASPPQTAGIGTENAMVIQEEVKLRAIPSEEGEVVAVLKFRASLQVLQGNVESRSALPGGWALVDNFEGEKRHAGYVPRNAISMTLAKKDDLIFVCASDRFFVLRKDKILAETYATICDPDWFATMEVTPGRGFSGVQSIATIQYDEQTCLGHRNRAFIFWTGQKLIAAYQTSDQVDGRAWTQETVVFPDEKGGRPDSLHILQESGDENEPVRKSDLWLHWNGAQFQ